MLYLLVALELGGGVLQRTSSLLDGLEDHLGVGKIGSVIGNGSRIKERGE